MFKVKKRLVVLSVTSENVVLYHNHSLLTKEFTFLYKQLYIRHKGFRVQRLVQGHLVTTCGQEEVGVD